MVSFPAVTAAENAFLITKSATLHTNIIEREERRGKAKRRGGAGRRRARGEEKRKSFSDR
jgi:hypothetical protein